MEIVIISLLMLIVCGLDACKLINIVKKRFFIVYLIVVPHLPLLWFHFIINSTGSDGSVSNTLLIVLFAFASIIFQLYSTLRLHFQMLREERTDNIRINIIYSGRNLIKCGLWGLYILLLWYAVCYFVLPVNPYDAILGYSFNIFSGISNSVKVYAAISFEVIYSVVFIWLFLINGCFRVFFGSRNLVVGKRVFIFLFMWVPIVQLFLAKILCDAAKDEYLVTVSRSKDAAFTKEDDLCDTKYPIIMVHGIGFRDLQYFNYWGRIPKLLEQHGAKIYYGHQNAWGTIEDNALAIKDIIDKALEDNECDKVNIIAHSKGGLDSRYLISSMGYGDKVASLTTINTPHRGSELITVLNRLPDYVYRYISDQINKPFLLAGDNEPDCYSSSKQLDPEFCAKFNENNPDAEGVLYQSYTSVMKNVFSDTLLWFPYLVMCFVAGRRNDGLVHEASAKWGNYKSTFTNKYVRGISHGDMIDLKREDIRGFDVIKEFYEIVCELKKNGY